VEHRDISLYAHPAIAGIRGLRLRDLGFKELNTRGLWIMRNVYSLLRSCFKNRGNDSSIFKLSSSPFIALCIIVFGSNPLCGIPPVNNSHITTP